MSDYELKHIRELALRAAHTGRTQFTRFMDPVALEEARREAVGCGAKCACFGGYPEAERAMAAFYRDEAPPEADYPLRAIRITWNAKYDHPGHRDLLGAVMGLGIERDATGDVAMGEYQDAPCAYLFAAEELSDYIAASLESAGRAAVKACVAEETPAIRPPEGEHMRVTVTSQRLDAVLAAGYHLSRTEAQRLVQGGLVKLNHAVNLRPDAHVEAGDLISARGHGRLSVTGVVGETRRGRLAMALFRYGDRR